MSLSTGTRSLLNHVNRIQRCRAASFCGTDSDANLSPAQAVLETVHNFSYSHLQQFMLARNILFGFCLLKNLLACSKLDPEPHQNFYPEPVHCRINTRGEKRWALYRSEGSGDGQLWRCWSCSGGRQPRQLALWPLQGRQETQANHQTTGGGHTSVVQRHQVRDEINHLITVVSLRQYRRQIQQTVIP
jgi:hypothetical protein